MAKKIPNLAIIVRGKKMYFDDYEREIRCPLCGRVRPHNRFGGIGHCDCASRKAEEEAREAEKKALEQTAQMRAKCSHHWELKTHRGYQYYRCSICGEEKGY